MPENLEYQARFKADTADLDRMNQKLDQSGTQMQALSDAGTGLVVGLTGMKDALNGSVSGLLAMAYGAGTAWKALATLAPVLKVIAIGLAAAQAAQILWNHFSEKGTQKAKEQAQAVKELGLELSEIDKHNDAVDAMSDSFDRLERAADAAADAIRRVENAKRSLNQANADAEQAGFDLDEAKALAAPGLTEEDRNRIQRDFIEKRAEAAKRAAIEHFGSRASTIDQERSAIELEADQEQAKRAQLQSASSTAASLRKESLEQVVIAALGTKSFETYEGGVAAVQDLYRERDKDPRAFLNKYVDLVSSEQGEAARDAVVNAEARQKELADFDADAAIRQRDRQSRLESNRLSQASLSPDLAATLKTIEAARLTALSGIDNAGGATADPLRGARDAVAGYRFDKLSDPEKLEDLERRMRDTREEIKFASDDPATRGRLIEQLVQQQRQHDTISDRVDADRSNRESQISEHQERIEELRNYRSTQAMDIQGVFQHMYNIKSGKNPDEQVADNTQQIADHMQAIVTILEEASS